MKFNLIAELVSKVWPIGNAPLLSGTVCSFFASVLGFVININFGSDVTLILALLSVFIGFYSTKLYIKNTSDKDPSEVVIDEFSGQLIAISAAGVSPLFNFLAFILLRIFDIMKLGIIGKVEHLAGALGIMMDDWPAGIFVALILVFISVFGLINYNWLIIWLV